MAIPDSLTVYFACPHCELVYQATQARLPVKATGQFDCTACRQRVHSWTGLYGYFFWKPVTRRAGRNRRRQSY
jgi:hypothetical protein